MHMMRLFLVHSHNHFVNSLDILLPGKKIINRYKINLQKLKTKSNNYLVLSKQIPIEFIYIFLFNSEIRNNIYLYIFEDFQVFFDVL